mmetsp:Transcript_83058/g.144212  ORF Transcript_83058/g.144212 Transcript_83058/m.144212 type:complete len:415 (+) Transcript_83058:53-1297(+)
MSIGYAVLGLSGADATTEASTIQSELMPNQLSACTTLSFSSRISDEVLGMIVCFALGFLGLLVLHPRAARLLAPVHSAALHSAVHSLKRSKGSGPQPKSQKEETRMVKAAGLPVAAPRTCNAALVRLPREIWAEVARLLELRDFRAVGFANVTTQQRFWSAPEAWRMLAADRGVELAFCTRSLAPFASEQEHARNFREAFRRGVFRIGGERLDQLSAAGPGVRGRGHAAVLEEASHMVRGLMPSDGVAAVERLSEVAERALQAHDPANKEGASAASTFLEVLRRRPDVFDVSQVERLESAYASALQLEEFMEVAMQGHSDQMELTVNQSQGPTPPSSSGSSPRILRGSAFPADPTALETRNAVVRALADAADGHARPSSRPLCVERGVDAVMEAQRHCELEAMLEELRRQTEIG